MSAIELPDGVTVEQLLAIYAKDQKYKDAKKAFLQTEAGKLYNRAKAKEYYTRHKSEVLGRRKESYEENKDEALEKAHKYYETNKDRINERRRAKSAMLKA